MTVGAYRADAAVLLRTLGNDINFLKVSPAGHDDDDDGDEAAAASTRCHSSSSPGFTWQHSMAPPMHGYNPTCAIDGHGDGDDGDGDDNDADDLSLIHI